MVFEISPKALEAMTMEQVKALTSMKSWDASRIFVHSEGPIGPGSQHGDGSMLVANIWRDRERSDRPIYTIGVMPNGDTHS